MKLGVVLLVAACGRIDFASIASGDAHDGPTIDAPSCGFRAVAAGVRFTCAIDGAGTVSCWGANESGQVSPSLVDPVLTPTAIALPDPAIDISAGRNTACARLATGDVWCWGSNREGELGDGMTTGAGPQQVPLGGDTALDVQVGTHQACVRRASDLAIVCWGGNENFSLANMGALIQPPQPIAGTAGTVQLALGHHGGCTLDAAGAVSCWGKNHSGELGNTGGDSATLELVAGLAPVSRIARAGRDSCAIETGGGVRCWGEGASGELGNGVFVGQTSPAMPVVTGAIDVGLGPFYTWALGGDGLLYGWGEVVIDGDWEMRATPRASTLTGVTQLAVGYTHVCVLANGNPVCWGKNDAGQLGRGFVTYTKTPQPVTLPATPNAIATAFGTSCARAGNKVYCWGLDANGQLADGATKSSLVPVEAPIGLSVVDGMSMGWTHACAWGNGGSVCWGSDQHGELGDGSINSTTTTGKAPVAVPLANITGIAAGLDHTCVITNGSVQCFGANYSGQLGNGTTTDSLTPVTVPGLSGVTSIAGDFVYTCAVASGAMYCWGDNTLGQLGNGTQQTSTTPVLVSLPGSVNSIAPAERHVCALLASGDIYCWGDNIAGELGLGDYNIRLTPAHVTLPAAASEIYTGYFETCARLVTGEVYCWGNYGISSATVPTLVPELANALTIAIENGNGCAIIAGQLSCWGQLETLANGDNSTWQPMIANAACMP